MSNHKMDAAGKLAKAHFRVDPQVRRIHLIQPSHDQNPDEPIKLLEVVEGSLECGILPVGFVPDPAHGMDYPSVVVEVSPREYDAIEDGKLNFKDWTVGEELTA
jgi:hypothetical protein